MSNVDELREAATRRIEAKRRLAQSVFVYLAVNTLLVVIWAVNGGGGFWPIWPILGWGLAVALQAWKVYGSSPITEEDISNEMAKRETRA